VSIGTVLLGSVAFVVERMQRSTLVIHLSTILLAVAVLALLFGFWRYDLQLASEYLRDEMSLPIAREWPRYDPLNLLPWHQYVPAFFSLACAAYLLVSSACYGLSWSLARVRRSAPAKVEADQ